MQIEILKAIIREGQELLRKLTVVDRAFVFESAARYVFVGVRQAGKSFLLYRRAQQLLEQGRRPEELLFINFDDERLIGFEAKDLNRILEAYSSMYSYTPILFLDEIQNVAGWEHFVRRLANQQYMVYVTGSNAKMLSRDIATTLGGRYIEQYVMPYSFREFLLANRCETDRNWMYGEKKGEVERLLEDYFFWGGFPELLLYVNKRHWLNELYEKIILGDIIARNGIKNEHALRLSIQRLAENIKTPTSYNRLCNIVKSVGVSTNVASIIEYIRYCMDACILFPVENFGSKFAERGSVRKHYFIDNGLLNIFLLDSETALIENLCALSLYRAFKQDSRKEFYFYNKEVELDFYLPAFKKGIQVCYRLSNDDTIQREVRALTTFHRLYGLEDAEIVTYSEEGEIESEGLIIRIIPLAKWLLELDE